MDANMRVAILATVVLTTVVLLFVGLIALAKIRRDHREHRIYQSRRQYISLIRDGGRGMSSYVISLMKDDDTWAAMIPALRQSPREHRLWIAEHPDYHILQDHLYEESRSRKRVNRLGALTSLALLEDPYVPYLADIMLHDNDLEVRLVAIRALADNPYSEECIVMMLDALRDDLVPSRRVVERIKSENALGLCLDRIANPGRFTNPHYIAHLIRILGMIGDPRAESTLLAFLNTGNYEESICSLIALKSCGTKNSEPYVAKRLRHPDPDFRLEALRTLAVMGTTASEPMVRKVMFDEDWRVRRQAGVTLRLLRQGSPLKVS